MGNWEKTRRDGHSDAFAASLIRYGRREDGLRRRPMSVHGLVCYNCTDTKLLDTDVLNRNHCTCIWYYSNLVRMHPTVAGHNPSLREGIVKKVQHRDIVNVSRGRSN